ncbi:hypothetical protein ABZP36_028806 [Zizania latifolia]
MDKYEEVRGIGSGNFGVARLMRNRETGELVAVKLIPRGDHRVWPFYSIDACDRAWLCPRGSGGQRLLALMGINKSAYREIINHRSLRHPNIVLFIEVRACCLVDEGAGSSGAIILATFQKICHRDLKLENVLLDGSPAPRLKICDFGYSKSSVLHSRPKSAVGTPAYIAPELLYRQEYDGKIADVWSCGVTLYVMLVGAYPFEDRDDPKNITKTVKLIKEIQYEIPQQVHISADCRQLISRIFVSNPLKDV